MRAQEIDQFEQARELAMFERGMNEDPPAVPRGIFNGFGIVAPFWGALFAIYLLWRSYHG